MTGLGSGLAAGKADSDSMNYARAEMLSAMTPNVCLAVSLPICTVVIPEVPRLAVVVR